jgi:hypothetical protein
VAIPPQSFPKRLLLGKLLEKIQLSPAKRTNSASLKRIIYV